MRQTPLSRSSERRGFLARQAWLGFLDRGARLLRDGSLREVAPLLPGLLDSDLREEALSFAAGLGSDSSSHPGVAYARAVLSGPDSEQVITWLLRARSLAEGDERFQARIARDLGARYLASAQPSAAEAILLSARGLLGTRAERSPDLLQLQALLADFADQPARARTLNERSLEFAHDALTPMTQAIALVNLAVANEMRDPRSSVSLAQLAVSVITSDRLHHRADAAARNVLGYALLPLGELQEAHRQLELSRSRSEATGHVRVVAFSRFNLAIGAELDGRPREADALLADITPLAEQNAFVDLVGWIGIRRCWLRSLEDLSSPTIERALADLDASALTRAQQDALGVLRLVACTRSSAGSYDDAIASAIGRDDQVNAFALRLQAGAREHGAGRARRARRLVADAVEVARALGLRAAPNWWSDSAVRAARTYEPEFAKWLVGGSRAATPIRDEPVTADSIPPAALRQGRTGPRVVRRLFTLLLEAAPGGLPRDRLCDVLWPDSDGDKANRNLYAAVDDLRRALRQVPGVALITDSGGYRVAIETEENASGERSRGNVSDQVGVTSARGGQTPVGTSSSNV